MKVAHRIVYGDCCPVVVRRTSHNAPHYLVNSMQAFERGCSRDATADWRMPFLLNWPDGSCGVDAFPDCFAVDTRDSRAAHRPDERNWYCWSDVDMDCSTPFDWKGSRGDFVRKRNTDIAG